VRYGVHGIQADITLVFIICALSIFNIGISSPIGRIWRLFLGRTCAQAAAEVILGGVTLHDILERTQQPRERSIIESEKSHRTHSSNSRTTFLGSREERNFTKELWRSQTVHDDGCLLAGVLTSHDDLPFFNNVKRITALALPNDRFTIRKRFGDKGIGNG